MKKVMIGDAITAGWTLYKGNFGLVFAATLLGTLLSAVSCGILAGPMCAGLFLVLARLQKGGDSHPAVGDVFRGFDKFLPTFLLLLVCGICYQLILAILLCIPIIGWLAAILLVLAYGPIVTWSLLLVVHRDMKWTAAVSQVLKDTFNGKFTSQILMGFVAGIIGGLGAVVCGFGILFTLPISFCIYAAAFEQDRGTVEAARPPELTA